MAPCGLPSISDSRVLLQGGTERGQLLSQPLHHWVLQLGLMWAVEAVEGIWIVQRVHLHTHTHTHANWNSAAVKPFITLVLQLFLFLVFFWSRDLVLWKPDRDSRVSVPYSMSDFPLWATAGHHRQFVIVLIYTLASLIFLSHLFSLIVICSLAFIFLSFPSLLSYLPPAVSFPSSTSLSSPCFTSPALSLPPSNSSPL